MDATVVGSGSADRIRVSPGSVPNSVRVWSENGTFPSRVFTNLSGTLFLNPRAGNDTITIDPLGNNFNGNVVVRDPDSVTLNSISLFGSLTVDATTITAANGSRIVSSNGDVRLSTNSESSLTFPLAQLGLKDRDNTASISIGSATIQGKNIHLNSYAGATRSAETELNQNTRALALADVNNDQRPDLFVLTSEATGSAGILSGSLQLFLNNGKSDPFAGVTPISIASGNSMTSVAVEDVNGDGKRDLVVGNTANPNSPGTQVFSRLFLNTGVARQPFRDTAGSAFNVGTGLDYTNAVAIADFDGDGLRDLVLGNGVGISSTGVAIPTASRLIRNQGGANPFAGSGSTVGAPTANTRALAFADLNQDGRLDLITGNAAYTTGAAPNQIQNSPHSRVFLSQGGANPLSGAGLVLEGTGGTSISSLAAGDVNSDGVTDILLGNDGKPSRLFLSTATQFAYLTTPTLLGVNDATKSVAIVDANQDGKRDLVFANAGVSRIYMNSGNAIPFTDPTDLGSDNSEALSTIAVAGADLNGDNRTDLVIGSVGGPTRIFVHDGSQRPYVDANLKPVSLIPSLVGTADYDQSNFVASVVRSKATSSVRIGAGATLTASEDVTIGSTALADARNNTKGAFLGLTYGSAEPTATVSLASGATVTAGGNFDFQAKANAVLDVSVITIAPAAVNIDVAYGKTNAISTATLALGSRVTARRVNVSAVNTNSMSTAAGGFNLALGGPVSGGLGVAISEYNSQAVANVNGSLTTTVGDATVDARSINVKDSTVGTASVIGTPDLVNFIRGLLKGVSNKLNASAKSGANLTGSSKQGTISSFLSASPSDFSSVGLAAGIAVPTVKNLADAKIGPKAVVTVRRNLTVNSRAEDNFKVIATGDSSGSSKADFGGGVAVVTMDNIANATIENGADVAVAGLLHVVSNAVIPNPVNSAIPGFRFVPPPDVTDTPSSNDADRIANGYQMGQTLADSFTSYITLVVVPAIKGVLLGNPSDVGTSFVKGTGAPSATGKLGIGGGVNVMNITNNSTARIGKGAQINQRQTGGNTSKQDVWVEADTTIITMNFGNQASLLNVASAGAGAGGAVGIGGQFEYIGYKNAAKAFIDDGAKVTAARDIKVTADTLNYLLTVAQAGAKAGKVGVGGTVVFHELYNQTLAYAEDGAVLNAGNDLEILAGNQLQVFNAGGGITLGGTAGVGVSVAANLLQQNDTWAFIGDNNQAKLAGAVTAKGNMDVKATADSLVVGIAISGSVADGLPNALEMPKGPEAFTSFDLFEKALLDYNTSLNPKGGVGVSGDATVNGLVSDTRAFILGTGSVNVDGDLTVAAKDTSLFAAASGAVAYGNAVGAAGSFAVNSVRRNTIALVDDAIVTAGSMSVTSTSDETPIAVTVGAGVAKANAAFAGSLSITDVVSDVRARVGSGAPVTTNRQRTATQAGGGLTVQADRLSKTYSVAGVASAAINGSAAVGLAVDLALQDGEVLASLNAPVTSAGSVRVFAADSQQLFGVAAGLAASPKDGAGVSGSVTVNQVKQVVSATIAPDIVIESGESVRVDADGKLKNIRVAGGVAGGKEVGVGGAITVTLVPDRSVRAAIGRGATVAGRGYGPSVADPQNPNSLSNGVAVDANTNDRLLLFAAAGAIGGKLGLAGSAVGNSISNNITEAVINPSAVINQGLAAPNQDLMVSADHTTSGLTVAGSIAFAKTAGVGGAVVTELIDRDVNAIIDRDANVRALRYLTVDATSSLPLTTVAGALAGGVDVGVAGSVVIQTLTTDTAARIQGQVDAGAKTRVNAGAIRVWADNDSEQNAVAGVAAGGSRTGIGASNVTIVQTNKTNAAVDGLSIVTRGATGLMAPSGRRNVNGDLINEQVRGMSVVATGQEDITTVAAGATGGKVGLAGSVTVTTLDLSTTSVIGQRSTLDTPFSLIAADDTNITGGGGAGSGSFYGGIGAGIDVQTVKKSVLAFVQSFVNATPTREGDVVVRALSTGDQLSISAALAGAGFVSVAGGASGIQSDNLTQAILGGGSTVTTKGNVIVTAEDTSSAVGIAGSVGASQSASIGASVGVAIVNKNTLAKIQSNAVVTANPVGNLSTRVADGGFEIAEQIAVGGLFNPNTDVNGLNQTIKLDAAHNFTAGAAQAVQYSSAGETPIPGLVDGRIYYVIVVDPVTVKLATTAQNARTGIADVFPLASASATAHSLTPVGQGPIPVRDSIDQSGNSQITNILQRRGLAPTQRLIQGVAVTAVNLGRIESYAASAGTAAAAVPISAAVDVINSNAIASVDFAASVAATNVLVSAGNELLHLGVGGAIGAGGVTGFAPGIHVPIATLETRAEVGQSAKIRASKNVDVRANASEDVLSFAMGLSRGLVAVGGSVSVLTLKSTTVAQTGANSTIDAGGNIGVESYDTTHTALITGAATAGGAAGLGGSVAVVYLDKETRATVGQDSTLIASGNQDSSLTSVAIDRAGRSVNGLLVQAIGQQDLYGVAAAGAIGTFGGLAGAVSVATSSSRTTAEIGDRAKVNNTGAGNAVPNQDVVVYANDVTTTRALAGAIAGSGVTSLAGGLAGGVDVGLFNPIVVARVGNGTIINANRDVAIVGQSETNVESLAASAAAGTIGVAGAVSVYGLGNSLSDDARRSLKANDAGNTATVGGYVDDVAKAKPVTDLLNQYQSNPDSSEADKRAVQFMVNSTSTFQAALPTGRATSAIDGNGSGSISTLIAPGSSIKSGGKTIIAGRDDVTLNQTTGTIAGGPAALGGAVGVVNVGHLVDVVVQGTVAADGDVQILSTYDANLSGGAGAGLGTSNGVTVGLIGIGAQVTRFNDQSFNRVLLSGAVTKADTLSVEAIRNRLLVANAAGFTFGGVVAGVASAYGIAGGSTTATITGQIGQAVGQQVGNLRVTGESVSQISVTTKAVAGGILSGAGSDALVNQIETSTGVYLNNARVKVVEDVTLLGKSRQFSSADADGTNVGGATMGLTQAKTAAFSTGRVLLSGVTVINAGRDINANAHGETKSFTVARASGGGVLSFGDSALAEAVLRPTSELRLDGSGVQLSAGRDVNLLSETYHVDRAIARSDIYGLAGTGQTIAIDSRIAKTGLDVLGSVVTAVNDVNMNVNSSDGDSVMGGSTVVSAIGSSPTKAAFIPLLQTDLRLDSGARITAGFDLSLGARTTMNADVTTDGSLRAIGDSSAVAETVQTLFTNISLGNAQLTGFNTSILALGQVDVANIGSARIAGIQSNLALTQLDTVTNRSSITSAAGAVVKTRFWNPFAGTVVNVNGSTNGTARTTVDNLDRQRLIDIKGQLIIG